MRLGPILLGLCLVFAWGEEQLGPYVDSAKAPGGDSALSSLDSLPKTRADSVVLIKHRFNHREQIITGGVVMSCIAAIMAIMNNYNPR